MKETRHKKVHLALQGGGAHGAFTWGVLDKILEDGRLDIDGMCATSAGSMNAVVFTYGRMKGGREGAREALRDFWFDVSKKTQLFGDYITPFDKAIRHVNMAVIDTLSHMVSPYQFNPFNFNLLKDILSKHVNFDELRTCNENHLFISATNVRTGKVKIFNNNELSIDVVMASASLPYLFQAVKVDKEYYWDGGYTGNPAIFPLFYHGKTRDVVIVHINPMVREKIPHTASEIMNRINEVTFNSSLIAEFRAVAFVNKMLEEGWIKEEFRHNLRHILVHSIRADLAVHDLDVSSKFDTHWHCLQHLHELGREEAEKWLSKNFTHLGKKSTVNLHSDFLDSGDGIA